MKIAIIIPCDYLHYLTPIWSLSRILSKSMYSIDIYGFKSRYNIDPIYLENKKLALYEYKPHQQKIDYISYFFWVMRQMKRHSYDVLLGVDDKGITISYVLSKLLRCKNKIGYFHLEYTEYNKNIRDALLKYLARLSHQKADFTLGLDEVRTNVLLARNKVKNNAVVNIANLHYDEISYNMPPQKQLCNQHIIINLGTFNNHTLIDSILDRLKFKDTNLKYIFHGWPATPEIHSKLLEKAKNHPTAFIYSQEFLGEKEYRKLLNTAHIGLAIYSPDYINTRYTGASSGKLFEYWRCGIPVICHKNSGMEYLVDKEKAGLCIEIDELQSAIDEILSNYEEYSYNAFKAFKKYRKLNNPIKILQEIEKLIAVDKDKYAFSKSNYDQ